MRRLFFALILVVAPPLCACTTFSFRNVFAANYDWDTGVGALMINKEGVSKISLMYVPARWVSRYASITFNQYGRDFPTSGMNAAGLSIALMGLNATAYPARDGRPEVGILEWIQYQLDVSATIDDVIRESRFVRINGPKGLHYLVGDRSGRAATIEFLNGALVAHFDDALPVAALTNDTYESSLSYLHNIVGFGGQQPVPTGIESLERFARAASMMARSTSTDAITRAFQILDAVHQPDYTRWSIVYDPLSLTVYFRTDRNPAIRSIALSSFDLTCNAPVLVRDVNGSNSTFATYTRSFNMSLVNTAYDETPFLAGVGEEDRVETALHPESSVCVVSRHRATRH